MESDKKVEIIQKAITTVMEDEEVDTKTSSSSSNLLSEFESMEEKDDNVGEEPVKEDCNCRSSNEEIIKELKNIKRQNTTTHWLVTSMIVLTVAWQLSEVSLIFKIKNGLSNPLKSVGGMIGGFMKKRQSEVNDVIHHVSEKQKQIVEPNYIPDLKNLDLPGFDTTEDDED